MLIKKIISIFIAFSLLTPVTFAQGHITFNDSHSTKTEQITPLELTSDGKGNKQGLNELIEDIQANTLQTPNSLNNNQPIITGGYDFSIARLSDGSLWSWGANFQGQLGLGDKENRLHPVKLNTELENKDVVKLLGGGQNIFALTSDGLAYTWGLGVPGLSSQTKPSKLSSNKVKDIAWSGIPQTNDNYNSYGVINQDGTVSVFGSGYYSQFGRGISGYGAGEGCSNTYTRSYSNAKKVLIDPVITTCSNNSLYKTVTGGTELSDVKLLTGGTNDYFFVAVTESNEIYTWGNKYSNFAKKNSYSDVINGEIIKITASSNGIFALTDIGEVWEWSGVNGLPKKISITNIFDVISSNNNTLILTEQGKVFGKGENKSDQLGKVGTLTEFTDLGLSNIQSIGLGSQHALFVNENGKIFGQGWNSYRQLANENDGVLESFTKINTISGVDHIIANMNTTQAVKNNRIYAWGELLGGDYGGTTSSPRLIQKGDFSNKGNVISFKGNPDKNTHSTVILDNGSVYTSGVQYRRNLGRIGSSFTIGKLTHDPNNNAYKPNVVNGVTYVVEDPVPFDSDEIFLIDAVQGEYSGVAVDQTGILLSWGYNYINTWGVGSEQKEDYGSSGISEKSSYAFIKVKSDEQFSKVDGKHSTRIALTTDGRVFSWGEAANGSLGRSGDTSLPLQINGLTQIKEINMGRRTGLALNISGDIYAWGRNKLGQAGNGNTTNLQIPVNITYNIDDTFKYIHSGWDSSFAISENGELYVWGNNRYGQLGLGDRSNRTSPRKVSGFPDKVKQVASGQEHTAVLLENGDVYVSGNDAFGQLGRGNSEQIVPYTEIPFPDYVELTTNDNQEVEPNSNLTIEGKVTSVVPGSILKVRYEVESSNGEIENGVITEFASTLAPKEFSYRLTLDQKYKLGGYTINVFVENTNTGLYNKDSINFAVSDKTPPTNPTINAPTEWRNSNATVDITSGTDSGSGVERTEYQLNDSDWNLYTEPFVISTNGETKVNARTYDKAGNVSEVVSETVKIDKVKPEISFTSVDTNFAEDEEAEIEIKIADSHSGVKEAIYSVENTTTSETTAGVLQIVNNKAFIQLPTEVGQYKITITATDYVGNTNSFSKSNITREGSLRIFTQDNDLIFNGIRLDGTGDQRSETSKTKLTIQDTRISPGWQLVVNTDRFASSQSVIQSDVLINYTSTLFNASGEETLKTYDFVFSVPIPKTTSEGEYKTLITYTVSQKVK